MAFAFKTSRHDSSKDDLWPTEASVRPADGRSRPSTYELGGMGNTSELSAKIKLLAELEEPDAGRPKTTGEPPPVLGTRQPKDLDSQIRPVPSNNKQPSLRKRTTRGLTRFLIIFGMGIAATLAWQSYGDEIRSIIANSSPQLGWLAPQAALAETAAEAAPIAPATASPESQQLEVMSISLAAMQQSIDQLTAQLVASQQQTASDNAKLKQEILAKLSSAPRPVAAPARKPAPVAPPPALQEPPER
jgi:hypothetical protein